MSRRKGERSITLGFQPLPTPHQAMRDDERRLAEFLNREMAEVVRRVDHAIRTSQAPAEAQQALGSMKQSLRAAAQQAMAAIGFSMEAREAAQNAANEGASR